MNNVISEFPIILSQDPNIWALAQVVADELLQMYNARNIVNLYGRIDELSEPVLDVLAYDFKIDWWDSDYTLAEKRRVFKSHWDIHRKMGTIGAVIEAVSAVYGGAQVSEWFEYGGKPYHFKISIKQSDSFTDSEKQARLIEKADYYKNLRSVFEQLQVLVSLTSQKYYIGIGCHNSEKNILTVQDVPWNYVDENDSNLSDEDDNLLNE